MSTEAIALRTENEKGAEPVLANFLIENGRLPYITDEFKPWDYRGWITAYVQLCEAHPAIAPRYDYAMRTIEAGRLLDEPIPQVEFIGEGSAEAKDGMKMLEGMVKIAEYRSGFSQGFEEILKWLGFGLGVTDERTGMAEKEQEDLYRLFDVSKWLLAPTDYLGQFMAERSYGKAAAFFPTPMTICTMMTRMTFAEGVDHRAKTTMDPCVGTGRFLLAASNYSLRLYGMDIMWAAVLATKINLALYAPWFLIPESLFPAGTEAEGNTPLLSEDAPDLSDLPQDEGKTGPKVFISKERLWKK